MTGLLTGHCHLKGHLFKLGQVDSPGCDRCRQASEMASHVPCVCKALAVLRFRHPGRHFLKPGDFADTTVSKVLHFVQVVRGCRMLKQRVAQKVVHRRGTRVTAVFSLFCSTLLSITTGSLRKINDIMSSYLESAVSRTVFMFCCILTAPELSASRNS